LENLCGDVRRHVVAGAGAAIEQAARLAVGEHDASPVFAPGEVGPFEIGEGGERLAAPAKRQRRDRARLGLASDLRELPRGVFGPMKAREPCTQRQRASLMRSAMSR